MPSSVEIDRATAATAAPSDGLHKHHLLAVRRVCLTRGMVVPEHVGRNHTRVVAPNQCCSVVIQRVHAPPAAVWSVIRRFGEPQAYKHFIRSCNVLAGDGFQVGSLREVHVISGLPAVFSVECLEILDEERRVMSFSVVGGDHRLKNYRSVTTVHESEDGEGAVVVESYVVDVPPGNTTEETCTFANTIVRCNLQSLAQIAKNMAVNQQRQT